MTDRRSEPSLKTTLVIHLLGCFSISNGQETLNPTAWKSRRARSLVKLLALAPGRRLHRDQVIDALWPNSDLAAGINNFHHTVFDARRMLDSVLPGVLVLHEGFLSLPGDLAVDVDAFETAARRAKDSQDPAAYQAALDLYPGDLLPDDRYEDWTIQPREALRQTHLQLLLDLAKAQETRQDYSDGIATLLRLLAVDPIHEEAHRGLMRLYALSGQRQHALRQFQALRDVLQTELEVEPSSATVQLYKSIQSGLVDRPTETTALVKAPQLARRPHHNLPNRLSTFIGREKEIDQVIDLLRGARLLTITGAGGVGKTSLALQAAGYLLETFPDGVWLVELAPLTNPDLVAQACAYSLNMILQSETSYLTALIQYLQKKHLLLILDNCEHVIGTCASLAAELLKSCPKLTILATSRELLNISGENTFRAPSLSVPEPHVAITLGQMATYESVRLFVERARQTLPGFSLTKDNAAAISLICQRLDGIPLAIELAAGRVRSLAVEQIAARLDSAFHLLTGGSREVQPRQQTLKATIDWSYNLLSPKERLLLQRLSVFAGGWTLEAAEALFPEADGAPLEQPASNEVLDLLSSLVDKSLVLALVGEHGTRYTLLETIRQYAQDRLLEAGILDRAHDRHLEYFASLSGQAEPHLRGKGQVEWLDRLEVELDNLRAAMDWSMTNQIDLGLKIAADLHWFWWIRTFSSEGRDWLKKLLTNEENCRKSLTQAGYGSNANRILQRARGLRTHIYGDNWDNIHTREEKIAFLEESETLLRKLGKPARRELAISLSYLWSFQADPTQPSSLKQEMLEIFQQEGMRFEYSEYLFQLPTPRLWSNADFSQIKILLEESLAIAREIEDLDGIASRTHDLGELATRLGDFEEAEKLLLESLDICRQVKDRWWEANCYLTLIEINLARGSYKEAKELSRMVRTVFLESQEQMRSNLILNQLLISAYTLGDYPELAWLHEKKREINMDGGFGHTFLCRAALSQKDFDQAKPLLKNALIYGPRSAGRNKARVLEAAAVFFSLQGKYRQAVRLFGSVEDMYQRTRLGLPLLEREEDDLALATARRVLDEETFTAAWKDGLAMTMEQAGVYALQELESNP